MFWVFLLVSMLGMLIFHLGTYSVLVIVLTNLLKIAVVLLIGISVLMFWRKYFSGS